MELFHILELSLSEVVVDLVCELECLKQPEEGYGDKDDLILDRAEVIEVDYSDTYADNDSRDAVAGVYRAILNCDRRGEHDCGLIRVSLCKENDEVCAYHKDFSEPVEADGSEHKPAIRCDALAEINEGNYSTDYYCKAVYTDLYKAFSGNGDISCFALDVSLLLKVAVHLVNHLKEVLYPEEADGDKH